MTTIYPTLCELSGLDIPRHVDGFSLLPLLKDTSVVVPPALMTYLKGNHAVRTERWRYIQYADGTEELYDHRNDPHEWYNLVGVKNYAEIIKELKNHVPPDNAEQVRNLKQ